MRVGIVFLLWACFTISAVQAQSFIFGPSVGYQYQKTNFLKASAWALTDLGYANYLKINAGANMAWSQSKAHLIPELALTYYLGAKGVWPYVKTELTPYTLTPKLGLSVLSFVDIDAGYGFEIKQKNNFKPIEGFSLSLNFNLPLNFFLR